MLIERRGAPMPEFRQNLATKEWIILSAERAKRPEEFARSRPPAMELPATDPNCPFCPGQEGNTPDAILTLPPGADPGNWDVRVVPNKFPALVPAPHGECHVCTNQVGPYLRREGIGYHEVVIDSPLHNHDLPLLTHNQMEYVMQAYCDRYNALIALPTTELVVIFRNHGAKAGTSLIHPHSQIVASSVVPFPVRNRIYEGQRYYDTYAHCVYCDMLEYELREGTRVVMNNDHFAVVAPYASSVPYEVIVMPKRHHATFGAVSADEIHDLAYVLQNVLARLWRLLDDPDYNYVIDTAPEHMEEVPFYHWQIRIIPKLTTQAGFEIGSGIGINVLPPEQAAEQLRAMDGSRITLDEANGR